MPLAQAPFVGREPELRIVTGLLDRAASGHGGTALVEGEAGIGKTTLMERALGASAPALVLRASGRELERERPFGLVSALMTDAGAGGEALDRPELAPGYELMDRAVDAIESLALRRPVVVLAEDAQWADAASLATIDRLARLAREVRLCLVVTARPSPRPPELAHLVETIVRQRGEVIRLRPLADPDLHELARVVLGAEPGERLSRQVAATGGNPLYVTGLLRALDEDQRLRRADGTVEVRAGAVPEGLRWMLLHRLLSFPEATRAALASAAILGADFTVVDLGAVTNRSASMIAEALQPALDAGLIRPVGDRLAFSHDLLREALYEDTPLSLRVALHGDAGRALARAGADAATVAVHLSLGARVGDLEAVRWLRRAAEETAGSDLAVAVGLLDRAVELLPADHELRDDVEADLAVGLMWSGQMGRCEAAGASLVARQLERSADWRARLALSRALTFLNRHSDAVEQIDVLLAQDDRDEAEQAILLALRAQVRAYGYDIGNASSDAAAALELGRRAEADDAIALALVTLCALAFFDGRLETALAFGHESLAHASRGRPERALVPYGEPSVHVELGLALIEADRFDEALEVLTASRRVYERAGRIHLAPLVHYIEGMARLSAGRWDDAVTDFETGLEVAREFAVPWQRGLGLSWLGQLAVRRDDLATARACAAECRSLVDEGALVGWEAALVDLLDGLVLEAVSDPTALDRLRRASDAVADGMPGLYRPFGLALACALRRAGRPSEAAHPAEVLEAVAGRAGRDGSLVAAAAVCRAIAEGAPGMAASAAEELQACGRPHEAAVAWEEAGAALLTAGEPERARPLLTRAHEGYDALSADHEVRRAAALARAAGARPGARGRRRRPQSGWESLTPTELRVAELAARGMINRKIAERLFVSPRTVETHVAHIFQKLTISSRVELAAIAATRSSEVQ